MKRKSRISLVGLAFAALLVLVIAFLLRISLHRPAEVVLPETAGEESRGDAVSDLAQEGVRRVEVTPETVQLVIERLARPESYSRTIVIERYWSGGSGQSTAEVRAAAGWMRLDVTENAETRHVITGDGQSWIWYGEDARYYSGAAPLTADEEQSIPTYEDILLLETGRIAAADYRSLDTVDCIYVETAPDEAGYTERCWIAVDTGLLAAAERLQGESVIYRMAGLSVSTGDVGADAFTLPDGELLFDPGARETEYVQ